jgi:pyridoxamine 5'-phosphate oxidase
MSELFELTDSTHPFDVFRAWLAEASAAIEVNPNAVSLATADRQGRPRVRTVLVKDLTERGFVFYTNYRSRKGKQLAENPYGALAVYWRPLRRQVLAEGRVEVVDEATSDAYFASRIRASQIGAWASDQSEPIGSRDELNQKFVDYVVEFAQKPVTRPPHWGGYCLVPLRMEFWQEQANRFHDRVEFWRDDPDGPWQRQRLQP